MIDLHVIFREVTAKQWEAYSRPASIYAGGRSLDEARDEFLRAAEFHFEDDWPSICVLEHTEREAAPGIFMRTALDRFLRQRERVADVLRASLRLPTQLAVTRAQALESSTGDIVFVCCMPDDRISWLSDQLGRTDAVQVSAPFGDDGLWWMPLAAPLAEVPPGEAETLADAGLDGDDARVADLVEAARRYDARSGDDKGGVHGPARTLVAAG